MEKKYAGIENFIETAGTFVPAVFQSVKKLPIYPRFWYNKENGGVFMEQWRKDARSEAIIVDLEALVPQDHLLF